MTARIDQASDIIAAARTDVARILGRYDDLETAIANHLALRLIMLRAYVGELEKILDVWSRGDIELRARYEQTRHQHAGARTL